MSFVNVEIIFKKGNHIHIIPVVIKDLFGITWMLDHSEDVVVFKVIDSSPSLPKDYGWGHFNKWVTKFTSDHFALM